MHGNCGAIRPRRRSASGPIFAIDDWTASSSASRSRSRGYIVDFLCEEARLIVEADGGQHVPEDDALRTLTLERAGYIVLRFWNNHILSNTPGVLTEIRRTLGDARP